MIPEYLAEVGRTDDLGAAILLCGFIDRFFQRLTPCGFPPTVILAGSTVTLCIQPYVENEFEVYMLSVKDSGGDFRINDFFVGHKSVFLSMHPIPAGAFSPESHMRFINLKASSVRPYMNVTMTVKNLSASTKVFEACLWGIERPPPPPAKHADEAFGKLVSSKPLQGEPACYGCGKLPLPGRSLCESCASM